MLGFCISLCTQTPAPRAMICTSNPHQQPIGLLHPGHSGSGSKRPPTRHIVATQQHAVPPRRLQVCLRPRHHIQVTNVELQEGGRRRGRRYSASWMCAKSASDTKRQPLSLLTARWFGWLDSR